MSICSSPARRTWLFPFSLIELYQPCVASRSGGPTPTTTVDRIRAFRRRHESPSASQRSPEERDQDKASDFHSKVRNISPGWRGKMDSLRSSTKRAHSPATPPPEKSPLGTPHIGGGQSGNGALAVDPLAPGKPEPPIAPRFLHLTEAEIRLKYGELVYLETERLSKGRTDAQWSRLSPDPVRDRYTNIHPWANHRIKLRVPEEVDDYINASPVTLTSPAIKQGEQQEATPDRYICMQGPKKQTVDHVWHMVWHELATPYNSSPAVIIMLSPTHSSSPEYAHRLMEKCYQYFPIDENSPPLLINEDHELGGDFRGTVRFVSREPGIPGTSIEVRRLVMTVEGQDDEKPILHYLYPNWPDFGALEEENVESILTLMAITKKANGESQNPRLIHCSAGVGRTGTYVALEFLNGQLKAGAWERWDEDHPGKDPIFEAVNRLREQRRTMVQSFEQYTFLYEVLRRLWEEKYRSDYSGGEHEHKDRHVEKKGKIDVGGDSEEC